ncbi:MAG TPA: hypothetical protein VNZ52_12655 [Candidatus Thermoplasmatota archaeon]|nr:hypothetical protein [Candidatus Thermoplasmatota archaeon]
MADFDTYLAETEDGAFYGIFDLTLPASWEPGQLGEEVLDALGDIMGYVEEMRRAIMIIERSGGEVSVSEEFEDALDVVFENRLEAEAALSALDRRDLLDFLIQNPADQLGDEDADEDSGGNGSAYLN